MQQNFEVCNRVTLNSLKEKLVMNFYSVASPMETFGQFVSNYVIISPAYIDVEIITSPLILPEDTTGIVEICLRSSIRPDLSSSFAPDPATSTAPNFRINVEAIATFTPFQGCKSKSI